MNARTDRGFPVFDADSHVLETAAIWTQHLEPEYRALARTWFWPFGDEVTREVFLNGETVRGLDRSGIPRFAVWKPGMSADSIGQLDPSVDHAANPGASDPKARLADMDAMGIDRALLYPTYFLHYFPVLRNPDVAWALSRAYNAWILEFASTAPDRLLPVAVLPIQNVGLAREELRRVARLGFRAALVPPVFNNDHYPAQRTWEPMWAEFESLGMAACVHPLGGVAVAEGDANAPFADRMAAYTGLGHPVSEAIAPAMDLSVFLSAFMADGFLELFPRLRLVLAHGGISWLPVVLEKTETYLWLSHQERPVSLEPGDVFYNRKTLVNFSSGEGAVRRMTEDFAPVGAWGSRYPNHDTGTAVEAIEDLARAEVPPATIARLMGGNAARIFDRETA